MKLILNENKKEKSTKNMTDLKPGDTFTIYEKTFSDVYMIMRSVYITKNHYVLVSSTSNRDYLEPSREVFSKTVFNVNKFSMIENKE
jgi:hypothetical protein